MVATSSMPQKALSRSGSMMPRTPPARTLLRVRRDGLLAALEHHWRDLGDTFEFRAGPRSLLVAVHPQDVTHVNVTHRDGYDKLASYDSVRRYLTGLGLVGSRGALWRRQRRLMAPMFTPRNIAVYEPIMVQEAERLTERWAGLARSGERVDIGDEMMQVTAHIILRTMFSTDSADIGRLKRDVEAMIAFTTESQYTLPLPDWVPTRRMRRYAAARRRVHAYIETVLARRRALDKADWPDDLLTRFMTARDDAGTSMDDELLRDESITIFFAGHETTARVLAAGWHLLDRHPEVADRLHAELDQVLRGRSPGLCDLAALPYTLAVVKEVLRLYPAAPVYARDAVAGDAVGGYPVPPGAAVLLSPYLTQRHPDFWSHPEEFDPDRWLDEGLAGQEAKVPGAYHPFATGHRICIGNHFSLLESHLLLAALAQRFSPRHDPGFEARWEMKGVLVPTSGLPMRIVARESAVLASRGRAGGMPTS